MRQRVGMPVCDVGVWNVCFERNFAKHKDARRRLLELESCTTFPVPPPLLALKLLVLARTRRIPDERTSRGSVVFRHGRRNLCPASAPLRHKRGRSFRGLRRGRLCFVDPGSPACADKRGRRSYAKKALIGLGRVTYLLPERYTVPVIFSLSDAGEGLEVDPDDVPDFMRDPLAIRGPGERP